MCCFTLFSVGGGVSGGGSGVWMQSGGTTTSLEGDPGGTGGQGPPKFKQGPPGREDSDL